MKNGHNSEWLTTRSYPEKNWKWYRTSTLSTTNIHITYLAPAHPKQ
jgi:hypothetical protein